jgi:hypothetical protein
MAIVSHVVVDHGVRNNDTEHMPLKKLVIEEANLNQSHLLSKKFIRETIEPQKGLLNEDERKFIRETIEPQKGMLNEDLFWIQDKWKRR